MMVLGDHAKKALWPSFFPIQKAPLIFHGLSHIYCFFSGIAIVEGSQIFKKVRLQKNSRFPSTFFLLTFAGKKTILYNIFIFELICRTCFLFDL